LGVKGWRRTYAAESVAEDSARELVEITPGDGIARAHIGLDGSAVPP
jgi:hypothetical protein